MLSTKNISLAVLFAFIATALFFAGRNSAKTDHLTDKYKAKYDSMLVLEVRLLKDKNAYSDSVKRLEKAYTELSLKLNQNHKKLKNDKDIIKAFTPDSRNYWNDSVLWAAGLR